MCDTLAVQELHLANNQISEKGVTALVNACASGSLAQLQVSPDLNRPLPNPLSLVQCTLLTQTRRLMCNVPPVQVLYLSSNKIGDAGLTPSLPPEI